MDVFSLLKFWRNAGVGNAADFDFTDDDEGSFFDLVFTNPKDLQHTATTTTQSVNVVSSGFHTHHYQQSSLLDAADSKSNHTYSSSHSLFFNNKRKVIMPLDTKTPRSPFRVLMLGFHNTKVKSDNKEIKCDIEEVTISSLLKRDDTFRTKSGSSEKVVHHNNHTPSKRFSKDVLHRYLNLIKPLYIKVSRRSNDKGRLHDHYSSFYSRKEEKASARKHFGKSRSSSSVVKHIPSPVARRDDSALQQQDGIQSAILHCKKSYNSPSQGCHVLSRSGSAPSQGPRISIDEEKRSSI